MWLLIALAIAIIVLSWLHGSYPWVTAMEMVSGIVAELPQAEATRKAIPLEILSLARAMESEESNEDARIAVGYCARNQAAKLAISITTLVTTTSKVNGVHMCPDALGHYSRQNFAKFCTTFNAPSDHTVQLAGGIINGVGNDPTNGGTHFDNEFLQDALAKIHPFNPETHRGYHTSAEIEAKRRAVGLVPFSIDGTRTRFWRVG